MTHKRKMTSIVTSLAALGFVLGLSVTPVAADPDPYLQNAMNTIVAAGFPGAYVNDTGSTAASGLADISSGRPMQANLNMRTGSITKSFVATVIMQLADAGQLSLDDTVEYWKPGLLSYGNQVTIRMLLNHTAGIPDYLETGLNPQLPQFINDPAFRQQTWTPQQIVALVSSQPPDFTPGVRAQYSDTNYIVTGLVVEAATGHALGTEIQNRIITPLGLTHTSFPVTNTTLPSPYTRGYSLLLNAQGNPIPGTLTDETEYNPSLFWATGALISNPADLNMFYHALLSGQLLSANMTAQMKQTVPLHQAGWPQGIGFGLGVWSWTLPCGITVWGHEGEVPGYNTWSFSSADGSRNITMEANQMKATAAMFSTEFSTYQSLWCR